MFNFPIHRREISIGEVRNGKLAHHGSRLDGAVEDRGTLPE